MRLKTRAITLGLACLILFLWACPTEQSDPGPTGPPGQPDTAWSQQMAMQRKAQEAEELEERYKQHREQGLKMAEDPEQRIQAINYLESALGLGKKTGAAEGEQQTISKKLAELHQAMGLELLKGEDFAGARLALLKSEDLEPGRAEVHRGLSAIEQQAKKLFAQATSLQTKEPETAIQLLAQILSMSDSASEMHQNANSLRGELMTTQEKAARDADVAKGSFDKAGASDAQTRAKALRADGIDFQKNGEYAEAIERYKESLDTDPGDHDLNRLIGECYALLNNRKQAATYYKRYVLRCGDCPHADSVRKILDDFKRKRF